MNCLKNKTLLIVIIFVLMLTLVGCARKDYTINVIKEEDIMMQEEKEYYVYFYKDECAYCDDVYDLINSYLNNQKELPLYVCKIDEKSIINRRAEGGNGQGPDGRYVVDWVISYDGLYIAGVPSLIKVRFNGVHNECFYVTSGQKNIIEYFEKLNNIETIE